MIGFNIAPFVGKELEYMKQTVDAHKICGDGVVSIAALVLVSFSNHVRHF